MPAKRNPTTPDPVATVHLQVNPGAVVVYDGIAYGDRATLQVPRYSARGLLDAGKVHEVDPREVPDVATIPEAA